MKSLRFNRSSFDHCLYFKVTDSVPIFLLLYVDDILIISPCMKAIKHVQSCLSAQFEMKDLEDARRILGMDIIRDRKKSSLVLSQTSYVKKILSRFFMNNL